MQNDGSAVGYGAFTNLRREDVMGELRLGLGGGLACSARIEEEELVLVYAGLAPRPT